MTYAFSLKSISIVDLTTVTFALVFILGLSLTLSNNYYYSEENTLFSLA